MHYALTRVHYTFTTEQLKVHVIKQKQKKNKKKTTTTKNKIKDIKMKNMDNWSKDTAKWTLFEFKLT